ENENENENENEIIILALKICGDFFFEIIKWFIKNINYIFHNKLRKFEKITLFVVPCCPNRGKIMSSKFIKSDNDYIDIECGDLLVQWVKEKILLAIKDGMIATNGVSVCV
ncbi:hypothetical protein C6P40_000160, partial [Pichia californica]